VAVADIEVTMVEGHASLKAAQAATQARRRPAPAAHPAAAPQHDHRRRHGPLHLQPQGILTKLLPPRPYDSWLV
jgi:hypothetical protein